MLEWFKKLNLAGKIAIIIGIVVIVGLVIWGIVALVKRANSREHFSFSNEYPKNKENEGNIENIAEAYTAAWIQSLKK